MPDSARLLQMLEPAVRPVAPVNAPVKAGKQPFEQRGFDDLLAEFNAHQEAAAGTPVADVEGITPADPPRSPLADLGRIENASLRNLIAQGPRPAAQDPGPTPPAAERPAA